jgi:hypothetical protein
VVISALHRSWSTLRSLVSCFNFVNNGLCSDFKYKESSLFL